MSTQTALGHSFPTPCKRCGGALYRQVDYCPYCGAAHPLDESSYRRAAFADSRTGAMDPAGHKFNDGQPSASETDGTVHAVHPDEAAPSKPPLRTSVVSSHAPLPPYDDEDESPYPPREGPITFRRVLLAIAAFVVIGLAFVAYALFSDNSEPEDTIGDQTTSTAQNARTTTGTIAPFAPAPSNHPAAAVKPPAQANTARITPPVPAAPVAPPVVAMQANPPVVAPPAKPAIIATPAKPAPTLQFRDVTQALQSARIAFRANDLSAAQGALGAALALQPGNRDAQQLASELRPLTTRRDSALQAAQTCVAQQSWPCARAHANEALTIDTGNDTAKSILERVIRETGWAPLTPHAGTGPAQGKPLAQTQIAAASQQAQLQTPLPQGMPANSDLSATAPRAGAGRVAEGPANSVDVRERAIKDSGWTQAHSKGGKSSTGTQPGQ